MKPTKSEPVAGFVWILWLFCKVQSVPYNPMTRSISALFVIDEVGTIVETREAFPGCLTDCGLLTIGDIDAVQLGSWPRQHLHRCLPAFVH